MRVLGIHNEFVKGGLVILEYVVLRPALIATVDLTCLDSLRLCMM